MPTLSRIHVAKALHAVFGQGSRIPETWDAELGSEDASFAKALLGLCLRRWGRLQALVQPKLKDTSRGLPLGTQVALAMGLAQLAWMGGVSDHAAVNESVELAGDRTYGFPPHKGLVNALLRAGARSRTQLCADLEALPPSLDRTPFAERVLREALRPFQQESQTEALWAGLQEPARPCFRAIKSGPLPPGLLADPTLPECYTLASGAVLPRPWLEEGRGMVQDRSSQALMAFTWDRPVHRVVDLCAAPGGKTTSLALRWPQAELWAVEQNPRRARRLEENLRARGVKAQVRVGEAAAWLRQNPGPYDLILLDAPCSGTGTLRKHPELVWLGDGLDLQHLRTVQHDLVKAALPCLAPGGLLIYSVCSWLPEESALDERQIGSPMESAAVWPEPDAPDGVPRSTVFRPNPLSWDGEGFQAWAVSQPMC